MLYTLKNSLHDLHSRLITKSLQTIGPLARLYLHKMLHRHFHPSKQATDAVVDIVIPTATKDFALTQTVIDSFKKHIVHTIGTIYIIAPANTELEDFCAKNNLVFVDETSVLGYDKTAITNVINGHDRSGWIFQQLLKYGAKDIVTTDSYIVIDADTPLINPHAFIEQDRFVFFKSSEWNPPYFTAFERLFGYPAPSKTSFTSHMMVFNRERLNEMLAEIEARHGTSWDRAIVNAREPHELSSISDYENYGQWMCQHYPDAILEKPFYNRPLRRSYMAPLAELEAHYRAQYTSLSFHSYIT